MVPGLTWWRVVHSGNLHEIRTYARLARAAAGHVLVLLQDDDVPPPHGGAVQVDPMRPTLKPPGAKRLILEYDELLANFAFKFNLHRYSMGAGSATAWRYSAATRAWPYWGATRARQLAGRAAVSTGSTTHSSPLMSEIYPT